MVTFRLLLHVLLFCFALCEDPLDFLNEKQKRNLGETELSNLPESVQRVLREVILHGNATAHWCCNVATTKTIIETHSQLMYVSKIRDRVTYTSCGFLWLSSCSRHHYYYISSPMYKPTYRSKTIKTSCPDANLVCCKGYALVANHCLPLSEIPAIKDDLINLHNAGVLG
ncbi:uncharacterized protein LOC133206194 [Saccostrea echinata]|uniref:uncharacterized protein LOC133206194 n=1 Tax=Saccostrea echinata TaxID=191078 RepID=UPI002A8100E3|nr:uncharacterized protein LOC133206194 [Saccostrea echinata]